MITYADTSFFVSLYLPDRHSAEAQRRLHRAEWVHVVFQHVFHREISSREAEQVTKLFECDRAAGLWLEVGLPEPS